MTAEKDQKKSAQKCFDAVGLDPDSYRIGHTKARHLYLILFPVISVIASHTTIDTRPYHRYFNTFNTNISVFSVKHYTTFCIHELWIIFFFGCCCCLVWYQSQLIPFIISCFLFSYWKSYEKCVLGLNDFLNDSTLKCILIVIFKFSLLFVNEYFFVMLFWILS